MRISIKELLKYFDIKETTDYGDTTATISVVGEDLCTSIFKHYCESERRSKITVVDPNLHIPVQMKKVGKRLDRWIMEINEDKNVFYQAEIKSWCSRAIGGVNVPLEAAGKTLDELAEHNWLHHLPDFQSSDGNGINKVLVEMLNDKKVINDENLKLPDNYKKEPLLILWNVAKPQKVSSFFFKFTFPKKYFYFDHCWIFSCSLYLRHLYKKGFSKISVEMPNVERRLHQLNHIFKT